METIILREIGCVEGGLIHWIDGRKEDVHPILAGLKNGEWFEVIVCREVMEDKIGKIIDIKDFKIIPPVPPMTYAQAVEFRNNMPVARLSDAEWTWLSN